MKIIYHHRTRAEDAQGIHIKEIINSFQKLGHHVEVVGIIQPVEKDTESENSIISKIASYMPHWIYEILELLYNFYGFYLLREKVLRHRPDFIYERYALHNFAGILISKLYNIPIILEVNAPLSYEKSKYSKLFMTKLSKMTEKFICSNTHKTIVVSTPMKKKLIDIGVPEHKMVVIPNGVNTEYFNKNISGDKIRQKYNFVGKTVLGFVGWFRKWHGLEELLHVYSEMELFKEDIRLLLVGDGPAYDSLVSLAKKYDIFNKGVVFTGPVGRKEIPEYIAAFDIALQPDVTEYASPIKLFEYISMGKGVIAPDKDNIIEIMDESYEGLFQANNWTNMGEIIVKNIKTEEQIKKIGHDTYKIFLDKKYFWMENAKKTIDLL